MRLLAPSLLLLAACTRTAATGDAARPPPPVPSPSSSASIPDATTGPDPVVDLLHTVECTVAVSSKVDNPKDFPEHLVDGNAETAWNSRTGDLAGTGFIAFRIPAAARVTQVALTAGFDKVSAGPGKQLDLFTMNHRITKVRLSRLGADGTSSAIVEKELDPSVRTPQAIDLGDAGEAGGDFRLDVLATLAGTEKKWRELTVSELQVFGRAGGALRNPAHVPRMAIGSLDGVRPAAVVTPTRPPLGPFPSVADLCAAYDKAVTPAIDAAYPGDRYPGKIEHPHCRPLKSTDKPDVASLVTQGPFLGGLVAVLDDPEEAKARLIVQTAAGFSATNVVLWSRFHNDPGCMHGSHHLLEDARLVKNGTGQDVLLVRVLSKDVYWVPIESAYDRVTTEERAYACQIDRAGAVGCDGPVKSAEAAERELPEGFNPGVARFFDIDLATTRWKYRREPILGPAGDLRLAP